MANGRRHGNRDTQFGPKNFEVRAIDLDPSVGGLHQGARQHECRNTDVVYMAATDQMPDPNKALAPQEPSIHGPRPMADGQDRAMAPDHEPKVREANNRVLLEHYFLPGDLERQIGTFVKYFNVESYHESLGNLTPADVYHGRGDQVLQQREEIKRETILARRLRHQTENA